MPAILYPQWQPGHQRKGHKHNNYPVSFLRVGQTLLQVAQCTIFVVWGQVYLGVVCFIAKHSVETQCHLLTIYIFSCSHTFHSFLFFSVMRPKCIFVVYLMISKASILTFFFIQLFMPRFKTGSLSRRFYFESAKKGTDVFGFRFSAVLEISATQVASTETQMSLFMPDSCRTPALCCKNPSNTCPGQICLPGCSSVVVCSV